MFTEVSLEVLRAETAVAIDVIHTRGIIRAFVLHTVVYIGLTVAAGVSRDTLALVAPELVHTLRTVLTGSAGGTLVHV